MTASPASPGGSASPRVPGSVRKRDGPGRITLKARSKTPEARAGALSDAQPAPEAVQPSGWSDDDWTDDAWGPAPGSATAKAAREGKPAFGGAPGAPTGAREGRSASGDAPGAPTGPRSGGAAAAPLPAAPGSLSRASSGSSSARGGGGGGAPPAFSCVPKSRSLGPRDTVVPLTGGSGRLKPRGSGLVAADRPSISPQGSARSTQTSGSQASARSARAGDASARSATSSGAASARSATSSGAASARSATSSGAASARSADVVSARPVPVSPPAADGWDAADDVWETAEAPWEVASGSGTAAGPASASGVARGAPRARAPPLSKSLLSSRQPRSPPPPGEDGSGELGAVDLDAWAPRPSLSREGSGAREATPPALLPSSRSHSGALSGGVTPHLTYPETRGPKAALRGSPGAVPGVAGATRAASGPSPAALDAAAAEVPAVDAALPAGSRPSFNGFASRVWNRLRGAPANAGPARPGSSEDEETGLLSGEAGARGGASGVGNAPPPLPSSSSLSPSPPAPPLAPGPVSSSDPAPQGSVDAHMFRMLAKNVSLTLFWYLLSTALSMWNKLLIGRDHGAFGGEPFPAPFFMSSVQFFGQYFLATLALATGVAARRRPRSHVTTWREWTRTVLPNGVATGLDIGFSNYSLVFIQLSFYVMCKSTTPLFLLICAFAVGLERPSWMLAAVVAIICGGLALLVAGEKISFNWTGFALVMSAAALSGIRWTITQMLLHGDPHDGGDEAQPGAPGAAADATPLLAGAAADGKGPATEAAALGASSSRAPGEAQAAPEAQRPRSPAAGPVEVLLALTPVMGATLAILSVAFERPWKSLPSSVYFANAKNSLISTGFISAGAVIAFLMVWVEFALIASTSALTFMVAGTFKEIFTVAAAVIFLHETFTFVNALGVLVLILGVSLFNWHKYTKLRADLKVKLASRPSDAQLEAQARAGAPLQDAAPRDPPAGPQGDAWGRDAWGLAPPGDGGRAIELGIGPGSGKGRAQLGGIV